MRQAVKERKTLETAVSVSIGLDGSGKADIATGVGFFDHMLTLLAKHGFLDLQVKAQGVLLKLFSKALRYFQIPLLTPMNTKTGSLFLDRPR